jgi:chaperonin GroES
MAQVNEQLTPILDRVFIRPIPDDTKTAGGLFIPDQAKDKPQRGEVIAVGPGRVNIKTGEIEPMSVKPNDRVLYNNFSGLVVTYMGEDFLMMNDSDLLAVY